MADEPKEPDVVPLDDPTVPDSLVPIPGRVAAPTPPSELDRQVEHYKRCLDRGETVSLPDALWLLNELVYERDQRGKP